MTTRAPYPQTSMQLPSRRADHSAATDGALMWDRSIKAPVVSRDGAFVPLAGYTFTLGPYLINDLPATATTDARHIFFNTATASGLVFRSTRMQRAGEVVGAILLSDAMRTAGTATLVVRVDGVGQTFASGACVIDAATVTSVSAFVPPGQGVSFAAGGTLNIEVVSSGWSPITANLSAWLIVALDPFA